MDVDRIQRLVEDALPDWRHYYADIFEAAVDLEIIDETELPTRVRELNFNDDRANWKRVTEWHKEYGDE